MLNIHQLRQLAEQTATDAKTAQGRAGIFDPATQPRLAELAAANGNAAQQLHRAVMEALDAAEKAETPA